MRTSMDSTLTATELFTLLGEYRVYHYLLSLAKTNRTRTYRDYVYDTNETVAVEAGPNGPENVSLAPYSLRPHGKRGTPINSTTES
jgi:hypothetical protein